MTSLVMRGAALVALAVPAAASAQSLAEKVRAAGDGRVQFSYAAREGVCGNGRTWISYGENSFSGTFNSSISETLQRDPCVAGPVRVVLTMAGGRVVDLETNAGPPGAARDARDLGRVAAPEASAFLLSLAAKSEGRPGRSLLLPAMLADSTDNFAALAALAKDQERPRETRRSALAWLGRRMPGSPDRLAEARGIMLAVARDQNDQLEVRRQALATLGRLDDGAGIPALIELARAGGDAWTQKEAVSALARSGDPRAIEHLRAAAASATASEDVRVVAIRGLGREYATAEEARFLRDLYPKLTGSRAKEAVLMSLSELGGRENVRWLLEVARADSASDGVRRRALAGAHRAGAPMADLVQLYDRTSDARLRESLIGIYAEGGEAVAIDKLIAIARTETDPRLRRHAISRLSRSDEPRVKQALAEIVTK